MPFVLAALALVLGGQALAGEQLVQSREPQVIVMKAVIERRMGPDFLSQSFSPFLPGEKAVLAKRKGHGESLGLPWLAEDGTILILRQAG
jgi:hypothetical protein